jgi:AraC-like DNA-binding protein
MFRIIALLAPVFSSLFWAVILHGDREKSSIPRAFLSKFMILLVVLFTVKFFYFEPLPAIYPYFDIIHLYAGCLVFPFYHIYFRLLTIDEKFSWKAHARYFILPTILVLIYTVGVLLTPGTEYRTSLFNKLAFPDSPRVHFLNIIRAVINYYILLQVFVYLIKNFKLIRKYGERAEQFYSDIQDGKYNNANTLNNMIVYNSAITIICYLVFNRYSWMVFLFPVIYAVVAYMIGYMGYKQKPVNPTFEIIQYNHTESDPEQGLSVEQKKILQKLLVEFEKKKIYLESQLNILQVVQMVGTNRSYISAIINRQYNQNFCSFVNGFRIQELQRVFTQNPYYTNEILAECCGFGSVSSLKRSVYAKTGLTINQWKNQILLAQPAGE